MRLKSLLLLIVFCVGAIFVFEKIKFSPKLEQFVSGIKELERQISAPPPLRSSSDAKNARLTNSGIIVWTNKHRQDSGAAPLKPNDQLNAAALAKVKDMFARQFFAHDDPDGRGAADLAEDAGYEFIAIGENLALGNFADDEALVQAWMDSPGHRENILQPSYEEIGTAAMRGTFEGHTTWLAVQIFGRPISSCLVVNSALKNLIESNERELSVMEAELEAARKDMDNTQPKHGTVYNQKVDSYNAKAGKYNSLVSETKDLVKRYNEQVVEFNNCAKL